MKTAALESRLGHSFRNPELLQRSLTHRSWARENVVAASDESIREAENESFEFVGDSVLGLVIAETLFNRNPTLAEGDLTLMKHRLVSTATLCGIARDLQLGSFLRIGRGEEKTGGRDKPAILADTLEAVIAAIFFDAGYIVARAVVVRMFAEALRAVTPQGSLDYKTLLQETLQAQKLPAPTYALVRTEGMPHARTFFVEAKWDSGRSEGAGKTIKAAEMMAAAAALEALQPSQKPPETKRKRVAKRII